MLSKEKIIMVKKTTCQVKLQNHEWMISFTYHGKEECFYLCKEECFYLCKEDALPEPQILVIGRWKVEEFLEDKRKQDFRNYLNGVSGSRA